MALKTIPFCGQTYTDRTLFANAQEAINLYPMRTPQPQTTAVSTSQYKQLENIIMYPTPGYKFAQACASYASSSQTPIRCLLVINATLYIVCGNVLLSFVPAGTGNDLTVGTFTVLGTLNTSNGLCSIVCNTVQLAISDGLYGYTYIISSATFAVIGTGGSFPTNGVTNLTYYDGYSIGAVNGSSQVVQSNELDATTWQALAFDGITSFPDNLTAVFSDELSLYVFGPKITEVQVDVGSIPYAFQKISGVLIQSGLLAVFSLQKVANTFLWLASDIGGSPYIASMEGYAAKPISTPPVNEFLARCTYTQLKNAFSWAYRESENHFYCITVGGVTWSYDIKMDMWHKRSVGGGVDLPQCCVYWQGNNVVGDANGNLYLMSQNYSFYGNGAGTNDTPLTRIRTCQHLIAEGMTAFIHELQIDMQVGYGFTPDSNLAVQPTAAAPLVTLQVSRDYGETWHTVGTKSLGAVGKYNTRVIFRNLGRFRRVATFKLIVTDPVATYITGARADITVGKK
jgi:hypothetical protein